MIALDNNFNNIKFYHIMLSRLLLDLSSNGGNLQSIVGENSNYLQGQFSKAIIICRKKIESYIDKNININNDLTYSEKIQNYLNNYEDNVLELSKLFIDISNQDFLVDNKDYKVI